jgi:7-cyano-7-deazaguanine reductase
MSGLLWEDDDSSISFLSLSEYRYNTRTLIILISTMSSQPQEHIETFENPHNRDYVITISIPEFTCLCPKTGQPDFATLTIRYIPDKLCVELKSLKLYIWSFRDKGAFHEAVTNQILDTLVTTIQPRFMRLTADFKVRGGIYTEVTAEHRAENYTPLPPVHLPD